MSSRRVILFAIAFLLLIVVIVNPFPRGRKDGDGAVARISVVVAKHDIPPYTILSAEDVRTVQLLPEQAVGSFGGLREPVGLMTTNEVRAGNVIHRSGVLVPDPTWSEGEMLIFSFYVSTSRIVGGQLRPGHHVDLLVTRPETRDQLPESLWLAENLWVVGVYQASGDEVLRPTVTIQDEGSEEQQDTGGGAFSFAASSRSNARHGPANLVVVAAHRGTAKMIGDYLGARLYEPWVYVRPEEINGTETPYIKGRIDGLVFEDANQDRMQQREESGIDDVTVTLYTKDGVVKSTTKTVSGGTFAFDDLEPGSYDVVETDPEGYVSVTSNRLRVGLVEGQNLHIVFGDKQPEPTAIPVMPATAVPEPTNTPEATPTKVVTPEPTPTKVVTPEPTLTPANCRCGVHMSDEQDGSEITDFPEHTKEVWAVLSFEDCLADMAYSVRAYFAGTGNQERLVGGGKWKGGSGSTSVKVTPWASTEFEPGAYATFLKIGPENIVCDFRWWFVDVTRTAEGKIEFPSSFPVTGFGFEQERRIEPPVGHPVTTSGPEQKGEAESSSNDLATTTEPEQEEDESLNSNDSATTFSRERGGRILSPRNYPPEEFDSGQ